MTEISLIVTLNNQFTLSYLYIFRVHMQNEKGPSIQASIFSFTKPLQNLLLWNYPRPSEPKHHYQLA